LISNDSYAQDDFFNLSSGDVFYSLRGLPLLLLAFRVCPFHAEGTALVGERLAADNAPRVFWSGREATTNAAADFAKANGGRTLGGI
jgi:hypothetical protein